MGKLEETRKKISRTIYFIILIYHLRKHHFTILKINCIKKNIYKEHGKKLSRTITHIVFLYNLEKHHFTFYKINYII